jgi:hypothetical protein
MAAKQNSDISREGWVVIQISVDSAQVFTTVPQQKPGNVLVITIKVYIMSFSLLHFFKEPCGWQRVMFHQDFKSFIMLRIHQQLKN